MVAITEQEYLVLADLAYDNISTANYGNVLNKIYFPDGDLKTTYINEKGEEKAFLGTKRFKDGVPPAFPTKPTLRNLSL